MSRRHAAPLLAPLLAALLATICAAAAPPAGPLGPPGVPAERFPRPARPVAGIVSDRWSAEDTRERVGEAAAVMDALRVRPGETVADVGAGSGYYAVRLARRVGPGGRVIAEDVVPDYLASLRERLAREGIGNVVLGLGEPHDPRLPPASVDAALLVHMYHEIEQPFGLLTNLLPALRPGARVGIVDVDGPIERHGTPRALLECELRAVGFRETGFRWVERGVYLAVFEPPARAVPPGQVVPCPLLP